ncbi:MAG: hypothetical protein GTO22_00015 [Gemmatimonadales bacterium]|nr:hypothetical protein [Gemmatimonadales bacterium]
MSFLYQIDNGVGVSVATVTITINAPPTATNDSYETTVYEDLTVAAGVGPPDGLLVNDDLGFPAATLSSFGSGDLGGTVTDNSAGESVTFAGGTLTVNTDGSFALVGPTTPGDFTFEYRLSNSQGISDGTVALHITAAACILNAGGEVLANNATGSTPVIGIQDHRCAAGQALVGFEGRSGMVMDQLTYHCRALNQDCSAGGAVTLTSVHGASGGGSAFPPHYCAADEFITRLDLRIGDGTDRIQGRCRNAFDIAAGASNASYTSSTPARGTMGGQPKDTTCPDGYVAVGVRGGYRPSYGWPNSFMLICQPVEQ